MQKTALLAFMIAGVSPMPAISDTTFARIGAFATPDNMADGEDRDRTTSAEIISASEDGNTLVYSDSPLGVLGFVDITDPAAPKGLGTVGMDGEPTAWTTVRARRCSGPSVRWRPCNSNGGRPRLRASCIPIGDVRVMVEATFPFPSGPIGLCPQQVAMGLHGRLHQRLPGTGWDKKSAVGMI